MTSRAAPGGSGRAAQHGSGRAAPDGTEAARRGTEAAPSGLHAILVADGDVAPRSDLDAAWPGWDTGVGLVVAADGGALRARALGLEPDVVVGDWDSLPAAELERLRARGAELIELRPDKDESDTEIALLATVGRGATRVTVLGAFGGRRLDHALANVALLAHPAVAGCDIVLLDGSARASLIAAPDGAGRPVTRPLPGRVGDLVSLLPLGGDANGVTTRGLRFSLRHEPLRLGPARGLSNVREAETAEVELDDGLLLVVEHPRWVADPVTAILPG